MADHPDPVDPTDEVIEHSPLERVITCDGETVSVFIYRGRADRGWLLEIEDELGGSTVWEDPFDTDQAALDEALKTIDEEGIHSFAEGHVEQLAKRALWNAAVAQPDIAELRRTLDSANGTMSFHGACGLFAALASTPKLRTPREWLDLVTGDYRFKDVTDARHFMNGVMTLYNEVVHSMTELGAHCCPPPEDDANLRDFCEGYMKIAIDDPASHEEPARAMLLPIRALAGAVPMETVNECAAACDEYPERWLQRAREELQDTVTSLHAHWASERDAAAELQRQRTLPQRRATPKVGRNERCPCGSGKKFKKCCAQ
ncbi:MAG TPA: UPF0149 family protein [Polyangiales bacterium]|nr:UPF0149 family protein [Polyangiales bacterium]